MIEELTAFIGSARWFGGKGRGHRVADVGRLGTLDGDPWPVVAVNLVTIAYDDQDATSPEETYQVPLALYAEPQDRLEHAFVGSWEHEDLGQVFAYDAVHDRDATALYLQAFAASESQTNRAGGLVFHRLPGHELDVEAHSTLFSGEQSNSSVAFGEDSLMKLFRKLTPGRNPDIEIHEALTRAEVEHVPALYGWLEWEAGDQPVQLAMLQQFLRTTSDGWDLALASVRDLFAEADLHADEVGGDFAAESERLGAATAHVHDALASLFPTERWVGDQLSSLAEAMGRRLDAARSVVPELDRHAERLRATYDSLARLDEEVLVQRIHGDLHLGQTMRTVKGWKLVDFEGEPAKPLEERSRPDSRWRDVAGMLRSFDYAAHAMEADVETDEEARAQIAYRANEWATRNQRAFLDGYVAALGRPEEALTDCEQLLLSAYQADKAVYEAVYEARNRPSWLGIPLGALDRLSQRTDEEAEDR
jgi:maltokinase